MVSREDIEEANFQNKLRVRVSEFKLQPQHFFCCVTSVKPVTLSVLLFAHMEKRGLNRQELCPACFLV